MGVVALIRAGGRLEMIVVDSFPSLIIHEGSGILEIRHPANRRATSQPFNFSVRDARPWHKVRVSGEYPINYKLT